MSVYDVITPSQAFAALLEGVEGLPLREGLASTPRRAGDAWLELMRGYGEDPELTTFDADGYDEIIAVTRIPFYSLCEHHLLPFHGFADIAYLPAGRILGLSKFARVVDMYARRLQVQERLTTQIADHLVEALEPQGVAVVLGAEHLCMSMRGAQVPGTITRTSVVRGAFRDKPAARAEAFALFREDR